MLDVDVDHVRNVVIVRPGGALQADDFDGLNQIIDNFANDYDHLPGLVVRVEGMPRWASFGALKAHMDLIMSKSRVVPRLALVSDMAGFSMVPGFAGIFVHSRLRRFNIDEMEEAIDWAGASEREPEGYLQLQGFPENVIAIKAVGEITRADYEDYLIPLVRRLSRDYEKLRLLVQFGEEFRDMSLGAMWEDARLGPTYWRDFERIAIVTDETWLIRALTLFAPLISAEIELFGTGQIEAARDWIVAES